MRDLHSRPTAPRPGGLFSSLLFFAFRFAPVRRFGVSTPVPLKPLRFQWDETESRVAAATWAQSVPTTTR
ncbi:MAG: hypothetical protein ACOYN0_16780, partial [Phycisphaerales bacterium]